LIGENILVECFRTSPSFLNHRISPLARKYEGKGLLAGRINPSGGVLHSNGYWVTIVSWVI
jgi:hypothetical protein